MIFFFQNVLTVATVTVVLLVFQWKLALISLAITPVLVVLAYRYSHIAHPTLREVQQKLADVATVAEENIVGVHVVKSFAQEPQESEKFRVRSEAVFRQTIKANRQRATYVPLIAWIPLLAQAAVLLVGARMVTSGELSVGGFVAFNLYLGMLVTPLRSLGMWIGQSQRATASGERIFQVMDEPEEIAERPGAIDLPPGGGDLRFEDVSFEYLEGRPVLEDVTLDVPAGRTIALIGQTGAGKTTLTSLVPRFYDVTAGRVLIDGTDVRDVTLSSLRRAIGVISQDPFLFSASVRENITFGAPGLDATEVERIAKLAQAHEFIAKLPDGYDTIIGERGITLSGGQRQRLAIARALAVDPRPDDADHRAPLVDDRARRRDRRPGRGPDCRARHARPAARDERGLQRHLRARSARAAFCGRRRGARRRGSAGGSVLTCFGPALLWTNRHGTGAFRSQTRAPNTGIVNAVGGGFIPTQLKGGGAGEFGAVAAAHQTGGRGR